MIIDYPLTKANRIRLAQAFRDVPRVDLSIECAIEGQMGRAFVEDLLKPSVFMITNSVFYYFAGDPTHPAAGELLLKLPPWCLLMPSAPGWIELAQQVFAARLVASPRWSTSAASLEWDHLSRLLQASPHRESLQAMDLRFAERLWGLDHWIDIAEFDSPQDFIDRGVGFYLKGAGGLQGAAFAALVNSQGIEISIYVDEPYRRQGMATALASCLLLHCLEDHRQPHWDAANPESCALAEKLGYRKVGEYRAYYYPAQ
jgi:RimJ/RimL family protein N-acetyltransferase